MRKEEDVRDADDLRDPVATAVADRLRLVMSDRDFTANKLSVRMKEQGAVGYKTPDMIRRYLAKAAQPPLNFLVDAAQVLEVSEEFLILGRGEPEAGPAVIKQDSSGLRLRIAEQMQVDMTNAFPPFQRLGAFARSAVWEAWTHARQIEVRPREPTLQGLETAGREAADLVGRFLATPLKAWQCDPADLQAPELDSYAVNMSQALLCLLDPDKLRLTRQGGITWHEDPLTFEMWNDLHG